MTNFLLRPAQEDDGMVESGAFQVGGGDQQVPGQVCVADISAFHHGHMSHVTKCDGGSATARSNGRVRQAGERNGSTGGEKSGGKRSFYRECFARSRRRTRTGRFWPCGTVLRATALLARNGLLPGWRRSACGSGPRRGGGKPGGGGKRGRPYCAGSMRLPGRGP